MNAERIRGLIYITKNGGDCSIIASSTAVVMECPISPHICHVGGGCRAVQHINMDSYESATQGYFHITEYRMQSAKELLSTITNEDLLEILI